MGLPKITYVPSESDRASIAAANSCPLDEVPVRLTLGDLDDARTGVMFGECIDGYRITLDFEGRPALAEAAAPALVAFAAHRPAA